jgi:hypothetical protein
MKLHSKIGKNIVEKRNFSPHSTATNYQDFDAEEFIRVDIFLNIGGSLEHKPGRKNTTARIV